MCVGRSRGTEVGTQAAGDSCYGSPGTWGRNGDGRKRAGEQRAEGMTGRSDQTGKFKWNEGWRGRRRRWSERRRTM